MSIKGLSIDADVETPNPDAMGGSFIKATGLYGVVVTLAYLDQSPGGATSLNLHFKVASDNSIIRQTIYVTSGNTKGNKNYYVTPEGKKRLLPGMIQADQISKIVTGKELGELTPEEKTVNLYDFTAKAEKPTKVKVLTEMLKQPILIGLLKVRANRSTRDGKGGYNKLADERFFNEIDKVFHSEDGASVTERLAKAEPKVHKEWQEKYPSTFVRDDYETVAKSFSGFEAEVPSTGSLFKD